MQTIQFDLRKSIDELKKSAYRHFGRKVCAAFIAQQQGIKLDTAWKNFEEPIGDLWLMMAEVIHEQCFKVTDVHPSVRESWIRDHTIALSRKRFRRISGTSYSSTRGTKGHVQRDVLCRSRSILTTSRMQWQTDYAKRHDYWPRLLTLDRPRHIWALPRMLSRQRSIWAGYQRWTWTRNCGLTARISIASLSRTNGAHRCRERR